MLNPTNKRGTKMAYSRLRKFLLNDGYLMIGQELYMRVATNRKGAEKHFNRLKEYDPGSGAVRVLRLTERQYAGIWFLTGTFDYQELTVGKNCHIML
jgi:CRISPR-associated protein Cas2